MKNIFFLNVSDILVVKDIGKIYRNNFRLNINTLTPKNQVFFFYL